MVTQTCTCKQEQICRELNFIAILPLPIPPHLPWFCYLRTSGTQGVRGERCEGISVSFVLAFLSMCLVNKLLDYVRHHSDAAVTKSYEAGFYKIAQVELNR